MGPHAPRGPALAVFAHPDDPEIAAGATLAKWANEGREVTILILTNGDKGSQDPSQDCAELVRLREKEQRVAAARLGASDVEFLGFVDGELENTKELRARIVRVIRRLRPEIVVCPDPTAWFYENVYYNHSDHRTTGAATLDAVSPGAGNPHFFPDQLADGLSVWDVPQVWLAFPLEPNRVEDVTGFVETKLAAVEEHASQLADDQLAFFREWIPGQAKELGRRIGTEHGESFRVLQLRDAPEPES